MTQQSSFEPCFATSSPVSFTFCVSLLSWFILAVAFSNSGRKPKEKLVCYLFMLLLFRPEVCFGLYPALRLLQA